ncbi:MAG: EpsI family protein, partial [Candidatus Competibacteraceae bacterium]|nr:EpsI family protein [Candidatus Competibacteraceae bacterium]
LLALESRPQDSRPTLALAAPPAPAGWEGPLPATQQWLPAFREADAQLHRVYRLEQRPVHLYMAYYRRQQQGAELINATNALHTADRWLHLGQGQRQVDLGVGKRVVNSRYLGTTGRERLLIWHWYQVAGSDTTSPLVAKLLEVWGKLTGQGAAVIAIATHGDLEQAAAGELLAEFLQDLGPEIEALLAQLE